MGVPLFLFNEGFALYYYLKGKSMELIALTVGGIGLVLVLLAWANTDGGK